LGRIADIIGILPADIAAEQANLGAFAWEKPTVQGGGEIPVAVALIPRFRDIDALTLEIARGQADIAPSSTIADADTAISGSKGSAFGKAFHRKAWPAAAGGDVDDAADRIAAPDGAL